MKAHELYQAADPALVQEMFTYFRDEERDVYKTSVASLASARKLRPVFIQKKPVAEQIAWMHKTLQLRSSDMVGEHLLQVWFMKGHQPMLVEFCDAMGIKHNGEGSVEGELPDELDPGTLEKATNMLFDKFNPGLVALYLHVFNLQRPGGWDSLRELLANDPRLQMGGTEEEEKVEEAAPESESAAENEPEPAAEGDSEPAAAEEE